MDSAELTGWIAWQRYQAAQAKRQDAAAPRSLAGGL
jgi:hypothetical protein